MIEENWNNQGPVVLDFEGVRIASVSFFDEALGLLAREQHCAFTGKGTSK
jgi:hypothetical protein